MLPVKWSRKQWAPMTSPASFYFHHAFLCFFCLISLFFILFHNTYGIPSFWGNHVFATLLFPLRATAWRRHQVLQSTQELQQHHTWTFQLKKKKKRLSRSLSVDTSTPDCTASPFPPADVIGFCEQHCRPATATGFPLLHIPQRQKDSLAILAKYFSAGCYLIFFFFCSKFLPLDSPNRRCWNCDETQKCMVFIFNHEKGLWCTSSPCFTWKTPQDLFPSCYKSFHLQKHSQVPGFQFMRNWWCA